MAKTTKKKGDVSSMQEEDLGSSQMVDEKAEVGEDKEVKITGMADLDIDDGDKKTILEQVGAEYDFATRSLDTWVSTNLKRLKLYNNQKRKEEYVGEPLLFTHMDTWLSSLYEDQFDKVWTPREDGDIDAAENLTSVSEYDAELMGKDELDYGQDWDALFFSYGLVDMVEFDLDKKCPAPSLIDPLSFYYDTLSSSIDGNSINKGGMRFLGWSLYMSELDVKNSPFMDDNAVDTLKKGADNESAKKHEAREQRMEALGGEIAHFDKSNMGDNNVYEILEWRTWWDGKKVLLLLTPDRKSILGGKILPTVEDKSVSWFVSAKRFNPQPHQFKGMSLPDLLEDKQRKKAILINDAINLTRVTVYGSNAYNKNQIKNLADLKWGYDKWIAVDGDPRTAIAPVYKDRPDLNVLDNMLSYLDDSAQKASATPTLQQGVVSEQQRTLGELEIVAQSSRTRYSLTLKTFATGDKDFWALWYLQYKVNFTDGLSAKVVRVNGATRTFRELNRSDIICKTDPDIKIESRTLSEAERMRKFTQYAKVLEFIMTDPDADKRASIKYGLHLSGLDQDEIDNIMPPSPDEMVAREQNEMIGKGETPPFLQNENHQVHIRVHREAVENKIKQVHMKLHMSAIKMIQEDPMLDPMAQEMGMTEGQVAPRQQGSPMQMPQQVQTPSQEANLSRQ